MFLSLRSPLVSTSCNWLEVQEEAKEEERIKYLTVPLHSLELLSVP